MVQRVVLHQLGVAIAVYCDWARSLSSRVTWLNSVELSQWQVHYRGFGRASEF